MTKKIINNNYTFDASTGKITIPGYAKLEDFMIITENLILTQFTS